MSPSVVVFQGTSSIEENEEALDEETTAAALLLPPAAHWGRIEEKDEMLRRVVQAPQAQEEAQT